LELQAQVAPLVVASGEIEFAAAMPGNKDVKNLLAKDRQNL